MNDSPAVGTTKIKRHALAIGWDYWLASDEGQKASAPDTLPNTLSARQYLENRLQRAFMAGAAIRNTLCGNCGRRYVGPYEEEQHGTGKCEAP